MNHKVADRLDANIHAITFAKSLTDKTWVWRGGHMGLSDTLGEIDNLVDQILLARGVVREDLTRHRQPTLRAFLPDPAIFQDIDKATERLAHAIKTQEKITIYGDYDVDGATSSALMIRLLRALGSDAHYYIPDRLLEGYGPSGEALVRLAEQGTTLIVTVDCGAMAYEALDMAKTAGVDVIVVDHHKCAHQLPDAFALLNPNRLDENDEAASFGHLAAVGVAFLFAINLVRYLREDGYFAARKEPNLMALLDIVALGTVADVAKLYDLNRAFVAQGLKVMARRENIGLAALCDAAQLKRAPQCSDLGFALGPRINAAGRIGDSSLGVRLLTTEDHAEAQAIAAELSVLNDQRRAVEAAVQESAEQQISSQANQAVIIVHGEDWHPGVIGIVAGRIKEKTGKPSIVLAIDTNTGEAKGSGRSITGVDLGAAIIAAKDEGLLIAGGGHAMAAGMTLAADRISAFTEWLNAKLERSVAHAQNALTLPIDLGVAPRALNPHLVEELERGGPYGVGWPAPKVAVGPVRIVKADIVGKDHLRVIASGDDGASFKAIAFRAAESDWAQNVLHGDKSRKFWFAGRLKIDDWQARPSVEMQLDDVGLTD